MEISAPVVELWGCAGVIRLSLSLRQELRLQASCALRSRPPLTLVTLVVLIYDGQVFKSELQGVPVFADIIGQPDKCTIRRLASTSRITRAGPYRAMLGLPHDDQGTQPPPAGRPSSATCELSGLRCLTSHSPLIGKSPATTRATAPSSSIRARRKATRSIARHVSLGIRHRVANS